MDVKDQVVFSDTRSTRRKSRFWVVLVLCLFLLLGWSIVCVLVQTSAGSLCDYVRLIIGKDVVDCGMVVLGGQGVLYQCEEWLERLWWLGRSLV